LDIVLPGGSENKEGFLTQETLFELMH
jgi:hypothetical protein